MTNKRDARSRNLLNLGYYDFVSDLEKWSKVFYPKRSKDLTEGSSGKMMIEQASFIGDVLSFYLEDRFRNSNIVTANDIDQIYNLSLFLGSRPVGPKAARGPVNFYLEVPAKTGDTGFEKVPDMRYAAKFKNVELQNNNGINFRVLEDIDFSTVNTSSSLEARVSKVDSSNLPTHFILKTQEEVSAGKIVTLTETIGSFKAFRELELSEPNILEVISVVDSDGNEWTEVDWLAQESVFETIQNTESDSETVPYTLKIKSVPRRFITKTNPKTGKTKLIFGSGKGTEVGTPFVPDPSDIAIDMKGKKVLVPQFIDPQNFIKTRTLGLSPFDTTLTIKVRSGGGTVTNTSQGGLNTVISREVDFASAGLTATEVENTLRSFSANNSENAIVGGGEPDTPREVKENAAATFAAQGRLNTKEDYIARSLSLPAKFGKVFRVYASRNCNHNGGVQLYVLSKNEFGQLSTPTENLKKNLKNYLSLFTRFGQGIDILEGKIINISIDYTIVVQPGLNKTQVKLATLQKVKSFFNVDNWQLNQPIIKDDILCLIKETQGVVSVPSLIIENRNNTRDGKQYSEFSYSIENNTKNGIIFAPENGMFEVKFKSGPDIRVGAI